MRHHHPMGGMSHHPKGFWSFGPAEMEGPFGHDFGMRRGPGGGRRGRMFDGGELRLVLLKLIADEPRHGYDLIRAIEALSGGAYVPSPGVIYPTITLLDEMGFIEEQQSEGAKKRFAVTEAGQAHLSEHADRVAALLARLQALGEHRQRADAAPIRRAMSGLKMAVMERFGGGDASQEMVHQVAEMIDDLAQKVERLK